MRLLLLSSSLFFTLQLCFAQQNSLLDQGNALLEQYEKLYNDGRKEEAGLILDRGLYLLDGSGLDTLIGKFHNLYAYWHHGKGQLDAALQSQLLAVQYFERGYGEGEPTAFALHNAAFLFQRVMGQLDSAMHCFQRSLAIYQALERPLDIADEYRNIGLLHISQNDYAAAQKAYLQALAAIQEMDEAEVEQLQRSERILQIQTLAWLYLNLAEVQLELDDIRQLRVYLQASQDLFERHMEAYPELGLEVQENRARFQRYVGQREQSLSTYHQMLTTLSADQHGAYYRLTRQVIELYLEAEQFYQAIELGEDLLAREKAYSGRIPRRLLVITRQLVKAYVGVGDLDKAGALAEEGWQYLPANQPEITAYQYLERARVQRASGKLAAALESTEAALRIYQFPPSQALGGFQALKSDILFQLYRANDDVALLDSSEVWARKSWATLAEFEAETFRRRSFGTAYRRPTECLLQILFERYQKQPTADLQQEILTYLEAVRGRSLKLGRQWQVVDQADREAYDQVRRRYLELLKQRYQSGEVAQELFDLNDSLVTLGRQLDALQPIMEGDKRISVSALQAALPDEQSAALSFFVGKDHWFGVAFNRDEWVLHWAPMTDDLQAKILGYKRVVKDLSASSATMVRLSYIMHQELLLPLLQQLNHQPEALLISGDGPLSDLPWAALLTDLPQSEDFRQWPFLIDQYRIAYLPHLMDLLSREDQSRNAFSVGCFAPIYPERIDTTPRPQLAALYRDGFWALPGAQEEVRDIVDLYGHQANLFADEQLTAESFKRRSGAYSVLHLALHAVADETFPDESYLLFPTEEGDLEYLTALDLLTQGLDADLLVLSACYAGDGPWRPGDGVMSLAYALRQAGAQTVLSNYWATADQLSKALMLDFHRQLKAGQPLDKALQGAQLRFKESAALPQAAHPFYWAGFHLQGNLSPLPSGSTFSVPPYIWYLILALAVIAYLVMRRRSSLAR